MLRGIARFLPRRPLATPGKYSSSSPWESAKDFRTTANAFATFAPSSEDMARYGTYPRELRNVDRAPQTNTKPVGAAYDSHGQRAIQIQDPSKEERTYDGANGTYSLMLDTGGKIVGYRMTRDFMVGGAGTAPWSLIGPKFRKTYKNWPQGMALFRLGLP